jgi:hypothetical protein
MGPDRGKHLRNIAIIVVLAVIVWQVPGGGTASVTISNLLSLILIGGMLFLGYRMYMENRQTVFGLEERNRTILYVALGVVAITLVATQRLWDQGGLGALVWLALLGSAGWAVYSVWRAYRTY